jgi:hypothetical protein
MTKSVPVHRIRLILLAALAMTAGAELFYLPVFGFFLYPAGDPAAKIMWTATCSVAMAAVIAAGVLLFAETRKTDAGRFWAAAAAMGAVGSYCAWLCSRIDATFNYFGGAESPAVFIASGVVPAIVGGLLYAWILQRSDGPFPDSSHP